MRQPEREVFAIRTLDRIDVLLAEGDVKEAREEVRDALRGLGLTPSGPRPWANEQGARL